MKKLILSIVMSTLPLTAFAAGGHGPAGCGLGTAVIFKNPKSWVEHTLAHFTNVSGSSNQAFGITSGTLGCKDAGGPLAYGVDMFINDNLDQIAAESAVGKGETLSALSELIGVSAAEDSAFKLLMKTNFDTLFLFEETNANHVYNALVNIMSSNIHWSKYLV